MYEDGARSQSRLGNTVACLHTIFKCTPFLRYSGTSNGDSQCLYTNVCNNAYEDIDQTDQIQWACIVLCAPKQEIGRCLVRRAFALISISKNKSFVSRFMGAFHFWLILWWVWPTLSVIFQLAPHRQDNRKRSQCCHISLQYSSSFLCYIWEGKESIRLKKYLIHLLPPN